LTLGNHDDRDHFRSVLNCESIGVAGLETKHVAVIPAAGHRFVLLDSLDAVNVTPGKIGPDQLGWLTRILDAEPQVPVIVMVHHNLTGKGGSLTDEAALVEVLKPRRQVKAVLFGHTHVWEHRAGEADIHLVNLPAVAYPFGADQPVGWTRLALSPEAAALELHCVGGNREKDGQRIELSWRSS
jgi:3',5'-cyclic AMP phosphodiesterase CpdA